jgi:predicted nucleotidyltransferase
MQKNFDSHAIARDIAAEFAELEMIEAVVLGGSLATGRATNQSDIDLYIYSPTPIPLEARAKMIEGRSSRMELDAPFWETEDYWIERESGIKAEAIYRGEWPLETLKDMFANNRAHMGFSTSIWHNIATSEILFDRKGWFARLQKIAEIPYPDALANAIIRKNFALLRGSLAEHPKQLAIAVERNDVILVLNILHMVFNSYFDILFALNRALHPGAKRQLAYAKELSLQPEGMTEDIASLVANYDSSKVTAKVEQLIDHLETLLIKQGALHQALS